MHVCMCLCLPEALKMCKCACVKRRESRITPIYVCVQEVLRSSKHSCLRTWLVCVHLPSLQYWALLYFSVFFVTLGDDDITMKVESSQGLCVAQTFQSFHMLVTGDQKQAPPPILASGLEREKMTEGNTKDIVTLVWPGRRCQIFRQGCSRQANITQVTE